MNLGLLIDGITLALVVFWFWRSTRQPAAATLPRELAHRRVVAELNADPSRTQKIAAYLRAHPECKSFRKAAAIVDGQDKE